MKRSYLLFSNEIGFFQPLGQAESWASSRIYLGGIAWPSALQPRFPRGFGPKLERQLRKSIQEIERARKAESEAGAQTGQIKAMPGVLRSTRQSVPPPPLTPEATGLILDRVARFTPQEMDSRKDRAMEILQKFIEQ